MDENKELLTILEVKENSFEMNKDVDISKLNGSQLRLGIISALGYQEGSNEVRMNVGFRVLFDEEKKVLFTFSIACKAELNGWKEMSHKELDVRMNPAVEKLLDYCYAYLGGALKKHTEEVGMKHFYLPVIEVKEIMPYLIVKELTA